MAGSRPETQWDTFPALAEKPRCLSAAIKSCCNASSCDFETHNTGHLTEQSSCVKIDPYQCFAVTSCQTVLSQTA